MTPKDFLKIHRTWEDGVGERHLPVGGRGIAYELI